ncbi:hypothetical protein K488DRAFT_70984 [Vararia minispora EC-137]|uniref:Uncharacterized protein n=1 Tax=Vararia minispora EC-137 TaxID=1314806 RepID=A0ACB8QK53_9AGAM|nr:hypothetical protein K488DRAFT_70984 [Vararia minispora EC-137]
MSTEIEVSHNCDSDDSTTRFQVLLQSAIVRFRDDTNHDLLRVQPFNQLLHCNSVDDLVIVLEKQNRTFKTFRAHGESIRAVLAPVLRLVRIFLETGAEIAAASGGVVPGGKTIFVAFGVLLDATRGVSEVYDALDDLFRRLGVFLARLDIYLHSPSVLNTALKDIFIKTLVRLFTVLSIVTKYLENNVEGTSSFKRLLRPVLRRTKDFGKALLGNADVKNVLVGLDELTNEEGLVAAAATFVAVETIRVDVQAVCKEVGTILGKDIKDWLNPPDPSSNHETLRKLHQSDTCTWFFDPVFEDWKARGNGFYWVNGRSGSGKSVLWCAL